MNTELDLSGLTPELLEKYDRPGPRYTSYPTAPLFSPEFDQNDYGERLRAAASRPNEPLSLYVHLPFCEQRCAFCGCNVVIAAARHVGLTDEEIQVGFDGFLSIRRRMEVIAENNGITLIDDFAHHPTAVRATLGALQEGGDSAGRLVAVFEPRSYTSRTRRFQEEYAQALSTADQAIVAAAPPGRENKEPEGSCLPALLA